MNKRYATEEQPWPVKNERPAVWDLVIADMAERDRTGERKYGTRLQPNNGRDALMDAYQEALDLCLYLRQAIEERDNAGAISESRLRELEQVSACGQDLGLAEACKEIRLLWKANGKMT